MFREDYVIRLIQGFADFLARIVGKRRANDFEGVLAETSRGWDELLGHPRELVDVVDTPTLAAMLREPDKMRVASQLLVEEGHALTGKGNAQEAAVAYRRAAELVLEARAIDPRDEDDAAMIELCRLVPASFLDER